MRIIAKQKSSWDELAKRVLSKKQQNRIKKMLAHAEVDLDGNSPFKEVLYRSWTSTSMGKNDVKNHPSEDWILEANIDLLESLYKEVNFDEVMDKLDYIK